MLAFPRTCTGASVTEQSAPETHILYATTRNSFTANVLNSSVGDIQPFFSFFSLILPKAHMMMIYHMLVLYGMVLEPRLQCQTVEPEREITRRLEKTYRTSIQWER